MDFTTDKPIVNILLFGLPGVGKTSLCLAFGQEDVAQTGFTFGLGVSRRAKIIEFVNEKCVYHIIDAPGIYDPKNEVETRYHANQMNSNLHLSSTPYIICFVICINENTMTVDPKDFIMMRTIAYYYNYKQGQAKFSLIINRLSDNGLTNIENNSSFRRGFLECFERNGNVSITDDNILFIRDSFLYYSKEGQRELLRFYLRKFEAVYLPELDELNLVLNKPLTAATGSINPQLTQTEKFPGLMQVGATTIGIAKKINRVYKAADTINTVYKAADTINTVYEVAETANTVCEVAETVNTVCVVAETVNTVCEVAETANTVCEVAETANTVYEVAEAANTVYEIAETIHTVYEVAEALNTVYNVAIIATAVGCSIM